MNIYKVEATVRRGEYIEHVTVIKDVTEKPKSYSKSGTTINKSKVNTVHTGLFRDEFETYVLTEEEIPEARKQLKEAVERKVKEAWEIAQENREAFQSHTFEREVKKKLE